MWGGRNRAWVYQKFSKMPHTGFKCYVCLLPFSPKASTGWSLTYSMPPGLEEMANENLSCSHQRR